MVCVLLCLCQATLSCKTHKMITVIFIRIVMAAIAIAKTEIGLMALNLLKLTIGSNRSALSVGV